MKKLLVIIGIAILFSCEKTGDRCYECIARCTIAGQSGTSKTTYCGDYTRREVKDMAERSMTVSGSGISCRVDCSLVD